MSPRVTRFGLEFGSSTPTACLPGIGARMRISVVASAYERSSLSAATFETFVPGASWSSKRVTRGPEIWPMTVASTPKFASVCDEQVGDPRAVVAVGPLPGGEARSSSRSGRR